MLDLIVVGAGPAGLMAAKTAAKKGLKVTVIELKKDITKVKRACSAQFVTDKGYENETLKIKNNKIIFTKNGFEVNYTGPLLNIIDNYHVSPSGYKLHLAHHDHSAFSIKFAKGHLLSDLYKDCLGLGVNVMLGTLAYNGEDFPNHVRVDIKKEKITSHLTAKKLVIAEGANAKLTGIFGLNKGRTHYGTPFVYSCVMEGTTGFEPQSWNEFCGKAYHPFAEVIVESTLEGHDAVEITVTGTKDFKPKELFKKFISESPVKDNFKNAHIIEERGCSLKSYDSLKKPYTGNVLVIGDSAAHIEVIVQGALMCGYHAALAIKDELQGKDGFKEYTKWWNNAFDFNFSDPLEFLKLYGSLSMMGKYTDEELDYLFSLMQKETIKGNFGQFEVPKNVWKAILKHEKQIKKERPELFNKLKSIIDLNNNGKLA